MQSHDTAFPSLYLHHCKPGSKHPLESASFIVQSHRLPPCSRTFVSRPPITSISILHTYPPECLSSSKSVTKVTPPTRKTVSGRLHQSPPPKLPASGCGSLAIVLLLRPAVAWALHGLAMTAENGFVASTRLTPSPAVAPVQMILRMITVMTAPWNWLLQMMLLQVCGDPLTLSL